MAVVQDVEGRGGAYHHSIMNEIRTFPVGAHRLRGAAIALIMCCLTQCIRKWGFRRCEDIVWIKSNKATSGFSYVDQKSVLQNTKVSRLLYC